ncbi:MAG: hypothetical protein ACTSW2_05145, partial [Alphaproteobacteria bacterium]
MVWIGRLHTAWRGATAHGRLGHALALGLGLAWLVPAVVFAQEETVDLEIILAVDASSSVSTEEFDLQMRGLA